MPELSGPVRQRIDTLLREGGTDRGIARQTGVDPRTVRARRQALGIPPRPPGQQVRLLDPATRDRITAMLCAGHSDARIVRETGAGSCHTVAAVRRELGIPKHPVGNAPAEAWLPESTREQITHLLLAGHTTKGIARELGVPLRAVKNMRQALGIPSCRPGAPARYASLAEAFRAKAHPTDDGHLIWPGYEPGAGSGPVLKWNGRNHSVYRIAFRLAHTREPVGYVTTGCGRFACVHPDHVEDQQIRTQYSAIFGKAA